jgi:hypothetical protein
MLSWGHYLLADLPHAKEEIARSKEVREQLGSHGLITDWFEALEAEILADAGEHAAAAAQAERALDIAERSDGVYARGIAYRALGTALAASEAPDWGRVNEAFSQSVDTLAIGDARLQQARTLEKWEDVFRRAGRDRSEFRTQN